MTDSSATHQGSKEPTDNNVQFNTDRTNPGRWTITFNNPPINMFVPTTIIELGALHPGPTQPVRRLVLFT